MLWHTEVEGDKPADIAPLLGMSANSVSALAYRAREGLRQAFLTQHAAELDDDTCRWTHGQLGAYVRNGISRRDAAKVEDHLDECRSCMAIYLELTEVNSNLGALLAPLLLGGVATAYLGTAAVAPRRRSASAWCSAGSATSSTGNAGAAAVAGVAASTVVVAGGIALGMRGPHRPATAAPTRAATRTAPTTSAGGDASTTTGDRSPRSRRRRTGPPARVLPPGTSTSPRAPSRAPTPPGIRPDRRAPTRRRHDDTHGHRPGHARRRRTRRRPDAPTPTPDPTSNPTSDPTSNPTATTRRRTRPPSPTVQPDLEPDVQPDANPTSHPTPTPTSEPTPDPDPHPGPDARRRRPPTPR